MATHGANAQTLKVARGHNFGIGKEVTCALVPVASEVAKTMGRKLGIPIFENIGFDELSGIGHAVKNIGSGIDSHVWNIVGKHTGIDDNPNIGSALCLFKHIRGITELAGRIDFNLHGPVGLDCNFISKTLQTQRDRISIGKNRAEFQRIGFCLCYRLLASLCKCCGHNKQTCEHYHSKFSHTIASLWLFNWNKKHLGSFLFLKRNTRILVCQTN